MRVLHVASWYPADERDIAGVFIRDHLRCLSPHVEQHVVVASPEGDGQTRREDGFTVARPRVLRRPGAWLLPYVREVGRQAQTARFDLVHAHVCRPAGVAARWVARGLRVPYLVTEHTSPFRALFETHPLNREAARWALRGARAVTAVTSHHAAEIRTLVTRLEPRVVPNTVDVRRFAPRPPSRGGPVRLLFIGRLLPQKGCDLLLEALATMPDRPWQLTIVGGGAEEAALRRRAAALGDRVRFLGPQPPSSVPDHLASAEVLVLPSRWESFGVVLIEALAAGVPVLATRCGGPEDVVTDGVGRLVAANDAPALASGLLWMLDHHRDFEPDRLRAHVAESYGFPAVARRILDLYAEVLEEPLPVPA